MRFLCGVVIMATTLIACEPARLVGPTHIIEVRGESGWPDLDEVLEEMQARTASVAPNDLWDNRLLLYSCDSTIPTGGDQDACLFDPGSGAVHVRVCGASARDWCLAHEYAHRWDWLDGQTVDHSPRWADRESTIKGD